MSESETELRCPRCDQRIGTARKWYDGVVWKANVLFLGTALAYILFDPPASFVTDCVRDAAANGMSASSCYPLTGAALFIGCLCYAGAVVCIGFSFYTQSLAAAWERDRLERIRPAYEPVPQRKRPWFLGWF